MLDLEWVICDSVNPGSTVKNIDELQIFLDNLNMNVVCISESWLKSHHSNKKYGINGFKLFRADRGGNRRAGDLRFM
jgi:hypothetical protein